MLTVPQAILGLRPNASTDELYIVRPRLPYWLDSVRVQGLRVGQSEVDLLYQRRGDRTRVEVLAVREPLKVLRTTLWPP